MGNLESTRDDALVVSPECFRSIEWGESEESRMRIVLCAVALALLCGSCGSSITTSASEPTLSPLIYSGWAAAQSNLQSYVADRALGVSPEGFRWIQRPAPVACPPDPEPRYQGCFGPDNPAGPTIEWSHPGVLTHESQHAILWALRDARWVCVGHEDPNEPVNFRQECRRGGS